jgi:hypothetical protein
VTPDHTTSVTDRHRWQCGLEVDPLARVEQFVDPQKRRIGLAEPSGEAVDQPRWEIVPAVFRPVNGQRRRRFVPQRGDCRLEPPGDRAGTRGQKRRVCHHSHVVGPPVSALAYPCTHHTTGPVWVPTVGPPVSRGVSGRPVRRRTQAS